MDQYINQIQISINNLSSGTLFFVRDLLDKNTLTDLSKQRKIAALGRKFGAMVNSSAIPNVQPVKKIKNTQQYIKL